MRFLLQLLTLSAVAIHPSVATATVPVRIVTGGTPAAVVVIAGAPSRTATYAAEELVHHVQRATGAKLPVVTEDEVPEVAGSRIFVGLTDAARKQDIKPERLGPDAFVLRIAGSDLYVLGNEEPEADPLDEHNGQRGTLFGVYELLHRFVGVRWLWPGDLGTYVPRADTLQIAAPLDEHQDPRLRFRAFGWRQVQRTENRYSPEIERLGFTAEGMKNYRDDLTTYLSRQRLGFSEPKPATRHEFSGWWRRHGKEHPQWFMMRADGQRGPGDDPNPWQETHVAMCVSNPDLHRYIVEEHWDGGDVLRLGEVDVRVFCQCPECLSWDGPQPDDPPSFARWDYTPRLVSDRYARFWKTIHAMAAERNPNVTVTTYLYWNYLPAPLGDVKLHEGIYGEFVPWTGITAYFPMPEEVEKWLREQWLGWQRTGMTMAYRPNYFHGGYVMPHLSTRQAGEFFRFAYRHGMIGTRYDSLYGHWATKGPMLYMHMRLFWNPELEIDAVRREYFSGFGPAAEHVERYFDYWEEYSRTRPGGNLYSPVGAHRAYPPEVFPSAEKLLEEALEAAGTDPLPEFAQRVEFLRVGLEHARLAARFTSFLDYGPLGGFGAVRGIEYEPVPVKDSERFDRCREALRELIAFRRAHEHLYIADFLDASARENRRMDIDTLLQEN